MKELQSEEKMMSYLDKDVDSYYVDLYKELIGEDGMTEEDIAEIEGYVNEVLEIISIEQEVIEFLVQNKGNWEVRDGQISFANDELADQYNQLLLKLE